MKMIPLLLLLLTVVLAIYPMNKSWGYVLGGSVGFLLLFSWFVVMFDYR